METAGIIIGIFLLITGFVASFLPVLPGPPFGYAALLVLQFSADYPFSTQFLILWAVITGVVMFLENIIPVWGAGQFGGSRYGVIGCVVGLAAGLLFFPPIGILLGPLLGAFAGEIFAGQSREQAFRAAFGSFLGFLLSTLIKIIAIGFMGYYFAQASLL